MSLTTWHKDIKSWRNINQILFKNEAMSDCKFLVKVGNITTKVPAHKYILGGFSPEFYNLFYLMKASDEIPIEDVSVNGLSSFLEFLYTEKTDVNMENVGDLFKLADRYSIECLKLICGNFVFQNITIENVLNVMDEYSIYELPKFETECLKIISRKRLCFEDPSFYEISNQTLTNILRSEELKGFTEFDIFEGTNKWAERFCIKNGQEINAENKRLAVGPALQFIRFGTMTNNEFALCSIFENSILTSNESNSIFQFIGTGTTPCPFSGIKRGNGIKKRLFYKDPIISLSLWNYEFNGYDILIFSVNKPIFIHGFEIYGRDLASCNKRNPEKFIIKLKDNVDVVLMENIVQIKYDGSKGRYEMFFKDRKLINANGEYKLYLKRFKPGMFPNYHEKISIDDLPISDVGGIKFNKMLRCDFCAGIIYSE